MKKLILLLLVLPFIFNSCSSDDDSLKDTTWECNESDEDYVYKSTVTFGKSTFQGSGYEESDGNRTNFSMSGTYTYEHPNVTITPEKGDDVYTGTVSGNKMTLHVVGEEEDEIIYTKK